MAARGAARNVVEIQQRNCKYWHKSYWSMELRLAECAAAEVKGIDMDREAIAKKLHIEPKKQHQKQKKSDNFNSNHRDVTQ